MLNSAARSRSDSLDSSEHGSPATHSPEADDIDQVGFKFVTPQAQTKAREQRSPQESPPAMHASPKPQKATVTTPTSILRRTTSSSKAKKSKRGRRVSFDLNSNTNHVLPRSHSKSEYRPLPKRRTNTQVVSPPPKSLSPGSASGNRFKSQNLKFIVTNSRSPTQRSHMSPVKSLAISEQSPMVDLATMSRTAVKRTLYPDMGNPVFEEEEDADAQAQDKPFRTPQSSSKRKRTNPTTSVSKGVPIYPRLADCKEQISHVLSCFQISNRRAVTQVLASKKVQTVGDLCSLSSEDISKLPITMRKNTLLQLAAYELQNKAKNAVAAPLTPLKLSRARVPSTPQASRLSSFLQSRSAAAATADVGSTPRRPRSKAPGFTPHAAEGKAAGRTTAAATAGTADDARRGLQQPLAVPVQQAAALAGEAANAAAGEENEHVLTTLESLASNPQGAMQNMTESAIKAMAQHLSTILQTASSFLPSK